MNRVKILIIEDELIIAERIAAILKDIGYEPVGIAVNQQEAVEMFRNKNPDLVLADINIEGDMDGIELMQGLKQEKDIPCIFVTSYSDFKTVERAKEVSPHAFLVKPIRKKDLFTSIEITLSNLKGNRSTQKEQQAESHIFVKNRHTIVKVEVAVISHLSADDIYTNVIQQDGTRYVVRSSIKQLLEKLPDHFIRIHKSHAINFNHLVKLESETVHLNNIKLPIGRSYKDALLSRINTV